MWKVVAADDEGYIREDIKKTRLIGRKWIVI